MSFHADTTGSYLRPPQLLEAQEQRVKGEITGEQLRKVEDEAVKTVVEKQVAAGLRIVSDGEQRRGDFFTDFLAQLNGVRVQRTEKNLKAWRFYRGLLVISFLVNHELLLK
jgi:5-methyltetrahydropteroyltriglutamate--homocysteine methyltransferase